MTKAETKKEKKPIRRKNVVDDTVGMLRSNLEKAEEKKQNYEEEVNRLNHVIAGLRKALQHLDPTADFGEPEEDTRSWEEILLDIVANNPGVDYGPKKLFLQLMEKADTFKKISANDVQKWLATQAADKTTKIIKVRRGVYLYMEEKDGR